MDNTLKGRNILCGLTSISSCRIYDKSLWLSEEGAGTAVAALLGVHVPFLAVTRWIYSQLAKLGISGGPEKAWRSMARRGGNGGTYGGGYGPVPVWISFSLKLE